MRARLPWILFFVSLALNISIVAGVLYVGHDKLFGEKRGLALVDEVADELSLSEAQEAQLRQLRQDLVAESEKLEQETGSFSETILTALSAETYNADAVRWFMIERGQPMREYLVSSLERTHAFLWSLDARQRQLFLDRVADDRQFLRKLFRPERDR
jgi:hypothetical protein